MVCRTAVLHFAAAFIGCLELRLTMTSCKVTAHIKVSECDLPLLSALTSKESLLKSILVLLVAL